MSQPKILTPSMLAMLAANAIAIVAAGLAAWTLGDLFRLYCIELAALGLVTLAQIAVARRPGALAKSRSYQGIFFVAHYSTACVLYYAVLPWLLGPRWPASPNAWWTLPIPLLAIAAAHILAFRRDFLPFEAAHTSSIQAMLLPYTRELPIHLPLIAVALCLPTQLASTMLTVLFAIGKTVAETGVVRMRQSRFRAR